MSSRDRPAEPHSFSIGLQAKRRMKKKPGAKEQTARSKRTAQSSSARSAVPGMGKVHPTTVASGGAREAPTIPGGTPTITQSSFNQTWTRNQTELAWDFSKKAGVRIGYRYGDRDFNHFLDYLPGDVDHFVGLEKTALFGLWARPIHALRLNFDLEHTNFNAVFVRLSPRKEARYRFQTTYALRSWATLGGSINILQRSNADAQTQYLGHNQNYGLTEI